LTSYEIHIITNYLHINCGEYGKRDLIHLKALDIQPFSEKSC